MTKLMYSKKVAFRKHVLDIEHLTKIIDNLDGILKSELTLFDKAFRRVYPNRDAFAVIPCRLRECLNILEIPNRVRQKLSHQ